MKHRALVLRRVIVTTTVEPESRTLASTVIGVGESRKDDRRWPRVPEWLGPEGKLRFEGISLRLTPWRRNEYGEYRKGRSLVLGWITSREPLDA